MPLIPNAQPRPHPSLDLSSPEVHIKPKLVQAADMRINTTDLGFTANALIDGAYVSDYYLGRQEDRSHGDGHERRRSDEVLDEYRWNTQDIASPADRHAAGPTRAALAPWPTCELSQRARADQPSRARAGDHDSSHAAAPTCRSKMR